MKPGRRLWLGLLAGVAAITAMTSAASAQQQQKPNIMFIMGDDIGWMQPSIYHRGLMVGETPNIDRIGNEGAIFMTYYAEQSCTAGRNSFFTGMHPLRTGMIPPQLPGSPSYLRPGTPALAWFLRDLGYNTGEFGKNHLGDHTDALPTAHGFHEFWGYLYHLDAMQGVSFPDINKTPTEQGIAPPCKNTPIPGIPEVPGAVDPKTTACLTPPRNVLWCKSSDGTSANQTCQDQGPLTLEAGVPRGCTTSNWNNFGPRLGFAWNPKEGNIVIRGGYGIFFDHLYGQDGWRFIEPYSAQMVLTAPGSFSNPYGAGTPFNPAPVTNPPSDVAFDPNLTFQSMAPNFKGAFVQGWNLTLEDRVTANTVVRATYLGKNATRLQEVTDVNPAMYIPGDSTVANTNQRRLDPTFGDITQLGDGARSWYEALQLSFERRARNFSLLVNYTFSKSIDTLSMSQDGSANTGPNPFNLNSNRGLSDFDVPQNFNASFVWNLPSLKSSSVPIGLLVNGWEFNSIIRFQSGIPFSVVDSEDLGFAGIGEGTRGDLIGAPYLSTSRSRSELIAEYFNTTAFAAPAPGTFGNSGRNILRGPGFDDVDLSIFKNFRASERLTAQLRGEFFNAFNLVNFGQPGNTLGSPNFGVIQAARDPRIVQLGLKLIF